MQLVLISLERGVATGEESYVDRDQFFGVEQGTGIIEINGIFNHVEDGMAVIVPAGSPHSVRNTGEGTLRFYTFHALPEHKDDIPQSTKTVADRRHAREHWDGWTTERHGADAGARAA